MEEMKKEEVVSIDLSADSLQHKTPITLLLILIIQWKLKISVQSNIRVHLWKKFWIRLFELKKTHHAKGGWSGSRYKKELDYVASTDYSTAWRREETEQTPHAPFTMTSLLGWIPYLIIDIK